MPKEGIKIGYVTAFMQFAIVSILPCIHYVNITLEAIILLYFIFR